MTACAVRGVASCVRPGGVAIAANLIGIRYWCRQAKKKDRSEKNDAFSDSPAALSHDFKTSSIYFLHKVPPE
jgi:hypothetical protein